nr:hypothetical protein [Lachnospiraceae bacterium]
YFFFIEAIGQFIHKDRLGVFILQIFFTWASLILIVKLSGLFLNAKKTIAVVLIFLFTHTSILWGGNTLEEYMLPLNLLVLYTSVRFFRYKKLSEDEMPDHIPYIAGLAFGIMLFAKVTVAAPIAGICLGTAISLLSFKKIRGFFFYCLYFAFGALTAIIPIILFFYYNGCLKDMLYCVFEFAYLRGTDFSDPFTIKWEIKLSACFLGFLTGILHIPGMTEFIVRAKIIFSDKGASKTEAKETSEVSDDVTLEKSASSVPALEGIESEKKKQPKSIPLEYCLMLILSSLITYVLLHLGNPWIYYFMTTEPIMLFSLILLLYMYDPLVVFSGVREALCLICMGVYFFNFGMSSIDTIQAPLYERGNSYYQEYYDDARALGMLIPPNERNSVFSLDTDMTFFEATQIMPCYKYQINLQFFIDLNPKILDEIKEYFNTTPPKWMIISNKLDQYIPELYDVIMAKYHIISENSAGCLYMLDQ